MAVASISLPQKLGVKLREKAKEAGYLPEEFGVEHGEERCCEPGIEVRRAWKFVGFY